MLSTESKRGASWLSGLNGESIASTSGLGGATGDGEPKAPLIECDGGNDLLIDDGMGGFPTGKKDSAYHSYHTCR